VRVTGAVRANFNAESTMIVGFDSHFLGYRHAAYYLPEFLTVQYPAVRTVQGTRIFAVQNRRTQLLAELPLKAYREFALFPLPEGAEYEDYAALHLTRFSETCLQRVAGVRPALVWGDVRRLGYVFADRFPERTLTDGNCKHALTPRTAIKAKAEDCAQAPVGCSVASEMDEPLAQ